MVQVKEKVLRIVIPKETWLVSLIPGQEGMPLEPECSCVSTQINKVYLHTHKLKYIHICLMPLVLHNVQTV